MTKCISDMAEIIIACISLFVAIRAIKQQNRGVVFMQRLDVYMEIEQAYSKCVRIVKRSKKSKSLHAQKNVIAVCLFNLGDEVIDIAMKAIKVENLVDKDNAVCEKEINKEKKWEKLLDKYAHIYVSRYLDNDIETRLRLFYSEKIADITIDLYRKYDDLRLSFLAYNIEELGDRILKLEESIKCFEDHNVLNKMKRELPIR